MSVLNWLSAKPQSKATGTRLGKGICIGKYCSLDWLSATSQSNNHRVLEQRQGCLNVCMYRSDLDLIICKTTEKQTLGFTAKTTRLGECMHVHEYSSLDWFSGYLQHHKATYNLWVLEQWQGRESIWMNVSDLGLTDYLYHTAAATGCWTRSKHKAEIQGYKEASLPVTFKYA